MDTKFLIASALGIIVFVLMVGPLSQVTDRSLNAQIGGQTVVFASNNATTKLTYDNLVADTCRVFNSSTMYELKNVINATTSGRFTCNISTGTVDIWHVEELGSKYINYSYYDDSYLTGSTERTLTGNLVLVFIVALLVTVGTIAIKAKL